MKFCLGNPEWWPKIDILCVVLECLCIILEHCNTCASVIYVSDQIPVRRVCTWFLEITFMRLFMHMCVYAPEAINY